MSSSQELNYVPYNDICKLLIGENSTCHTKPTNTSSTLCTIISSIRDILSTFARDGYIFNHEIHQASCAKEIGEYTEYADHIFNGTRKLSHICAALLPSVKLNSWLLQRISCRAEENKSSYDLLTQHLELLLEHYITIDYPDLDFGDNLSSIYLQGLRRHAAVLMNTGKHPWPGLVHVHAIGVDFDDTLSEGDTVSRLCKAALRKQNHDPAAVEAIYGELLSHYMGSYAAFMHQSLAPLQKNGSADPFENAFEATQEEFAAFIAKYSEFERDMLLPLEGAQALRGLAEEDIFAVADDIPLKAGSLEVLDFALERCPQLQITLLSLNWSRRMLSRAVVARLASQAAVVAGRVDVFANELILCDVDRRSTGAIDKRVTGPLQKASIFRAIIRQDETEDEDVCGGDGQAKAANMRLLAAARSVFIGDSVGDLTAMLEADVGVIIGSSSSLRRVCATFGITLASLDTVVTSATTTYLHDANAAPVLYLADSWAHIGVVLFGQEFSASLIAEDRGAVR